MTQAQSPHWLRGANKVLALRAHLRVLEERSLLTTASSSSPIRLTPGRICSGPLFLRGDRDACAPASCWSLYRLGGRRRRCSFFPQKERVG
jgi:hypothetical protein